MCITPTVCSSWESINNFWTIGPGRAPKQWWHSLEDGCSTYCWSMGMREVELHASKRRLGAVLKPAVLALPRSCTCPMREPCATCLHLAAVCQVAGDGVHRRGALALALLGGLRTAGRQGGGGARGPRQLSRGTS